MKTKIVIHAIMLFVFVMPALAERLIPVPTTSAHVQVFLLVEDVENKIVIGKNALQIKEIKTNKLLQTIVVNVSKFNTDSLNAKIKTNRPVYVEDINFDGQQDIFVKAATRTADAPSFQVFTYVPLKKQFALNTMLSNLTMVGEGLLLVNKDKKSIYTVSDWGCCGVEYTEYSLAKDALVKITIIHEDRSNDDYVVVTTQKLVNNEWVPTTKIYKASSYNKKS